MDRCQWDDCDEAQFEDWFYCEIHARRLSMMNRFLSAVAGGR